MNETLITLQGRLGGDVRLRRAGETPVASFRLACTPRRYSRKSDAWSDGETQWYTVTAWRALADNCDRSLRRGDPVVVHGRLNLRSYVNGNGVETADLEIEASFVGHDLNRGTTTFAKIPAAPPAVQPAEAGAASGPVADAASRQPAA